MCSETYIEWGSLKYGSDRHVPTGDQKQGAFGVKKREGG